MGGFRANSGALAAYSTFVSMQTGKSFPPYPRHPFSCARLPPNTHRFPGNTIFVGLGASGQPTTKPYGWARSLTSIVCFILGSFFFSRFCRYLGPLKRGTLVASFLLQSAIVFFCGAIVQAKVVDGSVQQPGGEIQWLAEILIALLSFQSSGQMVGSRNLSLSEIPTIVVTSVLCDFASDPDLMSSLTRNAKRNRRFLAFLGILIGAIIGGWVAKVTEGLQTVIWIVGVIKVIVTVSWAFWPQKQPATAK